MLGIIILLLILIPVIYLSYENLSSFKRKTTKILVTITLFVLIFAMQIGLIYLGFSNNRSLEEGQGEFILIILVPIIIVFMEAILMLLSTYLINKYNKKDISRKRFIAYILVILFLNSVGILLIY